MDRFHEMTVFVAVAVEGSFSAAAKRLDMSAPAVTRAVAGLETRLGIQMLCRTTRHVRVTTAGEQYLDDVRPILEDLKFADESILEAPESTSGEVSIAVPTCISRHFIAPIVAEYLKSCPDAQVSVISIDRPLHLEEEEFDMSISFGAQQGNLPHQVIGSIRDVYCATPAYLDLNGRPKTPSDLHAHTLIDNSIRDSTRRWAFLHSGEVVSLTTSPRISLSNLDACMTAVSSDFGIAQFPSYQVSELIASGIYELILEEYEAPPYEISVVHRPTHLQTTRASIFLEFLLEHLKKTPKLQPMSRAASTHHNLGIHNLPHPAAATITESMA